MPLFNPVPPAESIPLGRYRISSATDFDSTQGFIDLATDARNLGRRLVLPVREDTATSNLTQYNITQEILFNQTMVLAGEQHATTQIVNQGDGNAIVFSPAVYNTTDNYVNDCGIENLTITGSHATPTGAAVLFRRVRRPRVRNSFLLEHKFCLDIAGSVFGEYSGLRVAAGVYGGPIVSRVSGSSLVRIDGALLTGSESGYNAAFPGYLHNFVNCHQVVGKGTPQVSSLIDYCVTVGAGDVAAWFTDFYFAAAYTANILIKGARDNTLLTGASFQDGYLDAGTDIIGVKIEDDGFSGSTVGNHNFSNVTFGQMLQGIVATETGLGKVNVRGCQFQNIKQESVKSTGCASAKWTLVGNVHDPVGTSGSQNVIDIDGSSKVIIADHFDTSGSTNTAIKLTGTHTLVSTKGSTFKGFTTDLDHLTATIANLATDAVSDAGLSSAAGSAGRLRQNVNGNFLIWQRGTSFSNPATGGIADGIRLSYNGSGATRVLTQQAHAVADRELAGSPYFLRWDEQVLGSSETFKLLFHRIPGVQKFSNRFVTLTFLAKAGSAFTTATWQFQQNFGTGGSPSSAVTTSLGTFAITTSWKWFHKTVKVPSISGKTFGSNPDDSFQLNISMPTASTFTFDLAAYQISLGGKVNDYELWTSGEEYEAARRTYERIGGDLAATHFGRGYADSTTHGFFDLRYTEKRATPTITVVGGASDFEVQRTGSAVVATTALSATASHIDKKSCQLDATVASGLTAGEGLGLKSKTTSGYIEVSAEV